MEYINLIKKYPHLFSSKTQAPFEYVTDRNLISKWNDQYRNIKVPISDIPYIGILSNDQYYLIVRDLLQFPDGNQKGVVRVINKSELDGFHGVVVAPFYKDKIILLRIFRPAIQEWQLEFPRGFGEFGATPEQQARNEIEEEIGGDISQLDFLGELISNSGLTYSKTYLFTAQIDSFGVGQRIEGIKEIIVLSISDFLGKIHDGEIVDGFTLSTVAKIQEW